MTKTFTISTVLLLGWLVASANAALTFRSLASFQGTNGAQPLGTLTQGTNGIFYGTTSAGGNFGAGTVFALGTNGAITNLYSFSGTTDGAAPFAGLAQGNDGNFYGTTRAGGAPGLGTVFRITPEGPLTTLLAFDGSNGAQPMAPLIQGSDGNFYGTTSVGGTNGLGTLFRMTASGQLKTVATFNGSNGSQPAGALVQGSSGILYGTTSAGGVYGSGTIFRLATNGVLTTLYSFTGATDGSGPQSGLVLGKDGTLYGTTAGGGTNDIAHGGDGTLFKISPAGAFTSLVSFDGVSGANPFAPLALGLDGNFYGTTSAGGARGHGAVFSLSPASVLTNLYSFTGSRDGANPQGGVIIGADGNLYGATTAGGRSGLGSLFSLSGFGPFLVTQPTNQAVVNGGNATFVVVAGGTAPLSFQWQLNSNNLANSAAISGVRTSILTISNVGPANAGAYSVIVKNASGLISSTRAVLTVIGKPSLTITYPTRNSVINKSVITATGKTSGNVAVARVYFQLNTDGWELASTSDGWVNWRANLTLPPGTNVFAAYAVSVVGTLSPTNAVTFVCGITSAPVVVQVSGLGTVSPNLDGQSLQLGRSYTVTAKPGNGFLFRDWTGGVFTNAAKLTFMMESNLVLQANFVTNQFIAVKGAYHGLFADPGGVAQESSGFFTATTTDKGAFSGSLRLGGTSFPIKGQFDLDGAAQITIQRRAAAPLMVALHLDLENGTGQITGTISTANWTAELFADRAVFNGHDRRAPQAGKYTLIFPGNPASADLPGGNSYATLTVSAAGTIRLAGSLADGTKISQSVPVALDGEWPLYASLYGGHGLLAGRMQFTLGAERDLGGTATWIKPAIAKDKFYPVGFTNEVMASGLSYVQPGSGSNVLSYANGKVSLSGGGLPEPIVNLISIGAGNRVTNLSSNALRLSFMISNGRFNGSVTGPASSKPVSFGGVVLQREGIARGYFVGMNQSGRVLVEP